MACRGIQATRPLPPSLFDAILIDSWIGYWIFLYPLSSLLLFLAARKMSHELAAAAFSCGKKKWIESCLRRLVSETFTQSMSSPQRQSNRIIQSLPLMWVLIIRCGRALYAPRMLADNLSGRFVPPPRLFFLRQEKTNSSAWLGMANSWSHINFGINNVLLYHIII